MVKGFGEEKRVSIKVSDNNLEIQNSDITFETLLHPGNIKSILPFTR
jgi:hypothetical protein